jgi:hypothetical protein
LEDKNQIAVVDIKLRKVLALAVTGGARGSYRLTQRSDDCSSDVEIREADRDEY